PSTPFPYTTLFRSPGQGHPCKNPKRNRRHQPELASASAGGPHQQSHVIGQGNGGGELDLEHGDEFCVADASAGCPVRGGKTSAGKHTRSPCERFKDAVERAGVRRNRQRCV